MSRRKETAMTEEQLRQGHSVIQAIWKHERVNKALKKAKVGILRDAIHWSIEADDLENAPWLLPEEQEALNALREGYIAIISTANERELNRLKKEFEDL